MCFCVDCCFKLGGVNVIDIYSWFKYMLYKGRLVNISNGCIYSTMQITLGSIDAFIDSGP